MTNDNKKRVYIYLKESVIEKLNTQAKANGLTRSSQAGLMIINGLNQ